MEERVPLADNGNHDSPFPQTGLVPTADNANANHDSYLKTYIVQVPKDQIYRVPPPDHALMAERHRQPQKKPCCSRCSCVFISIIIIALIVGLVGGVSSIFLKHNDPKFQIVSVLVKNVPPNYPQKHPQYDISLLAENPNDYTHIFYDESGDALLSFEQKEIAVGRYPTFEQAPKNSTVLKMIFRGSNIMLPQKIKQSLKSSNKKVRISLSILMGVPIRQKIGDLKIGSTKVSVLCNLTVDTLAKGSHVLSQECHTTS